MGFWRTMKVNLHLASRREIQEHLDELWRKPGKPASSPLVKALGAFGLLAAAGAAAWIAFPVAALLAAFFNLPGLLPEGKAQSGKTLVSQDSLWRARLVAALLRPGDVQAEHDRWQALYGDKVYREELKPQAIRIAFWEYIQTTLGGKVATPADWTKSLDAEDLRAITRRAERDVGSRP